MNLLKLGRDTEGRKDILKEIKVQKTINLNVVIMLTKLAV